MISDFINEIFIREFKTFERGFLWGFGIGVLLTVIVISIMAIE